MDKLLTPKGVCEVIPGMTEAKLAQLRFAGGGPKFLKPTPKTTLYREGDLVEWLKSTEHERTDKRLASMP